jgi:probable HAF family extracellular repeat protein
MSDLGTLGGPASDAHDINDSGQIVGRSRTAENASGRAFLYSNGTMTNIGTLGGDSIARAINNNGDVVGQSYTTMNNTNVHAFIYSNGVIQDLNTLLPVGSGWTLLFATDINDYGQIVGVGTINGESHGFLMSPGC